MASKGPGSTVDCEWWNIKKAAVYLGVSVAFLRKAVRLRRVPFARVGSKVVRFRRVELDRWLQHSQGNETINSEGKLD